MDKVKIVLEVLKKHHFWALVGLVALLGLWIYMGAAADLKAKTAKRVSTLKSASSQVDGIASRSDHANEKKIEIWKDKKKQQEQEVRKAWQSLYDKQRKINRWPAKLGEKFRKKVEEQLGPKDTIPGPYCNDYWNAVETTIPELLETVDYQRYVPLDPDEAKSDTPKTPTALGPSSGRLRGLRRGLNASNGKLVGTVVWENHDLILNEFTWSARPSSQKVRLAQENYWVYKALLSIISKTNGDAKTHSDAAVKEIVTLSIGTEAADFITANTVSLVDSSGTGTPGASPSGGGVNMFEEQGMMGRTGMGSKGTTSPTESDDMLLNNRYVDRSLKPLSTEQTKNSPPYKEFNMMPIVMNLVIDVDKIPRLLVQCANSPMPVEVVQLRINPGASQNKSYGRGMPSRPKGPGMSGRGPGGPGGPRGPGGAEPNMFGDEGEFGGGGRPRSLGQKGMGDDEESPYEVTIEIRGIIYIYNPPLEITGDASTSGLSE